eukprot:Nitzschia sp. Nitz4//scaffold60_size111251//50543//51223//NITZ4_004149-RA/size111251-exonerate_protein2genome-gene-0.59-mRNA-1//1//CDS//3329555570//7020//frame0
MMQTTTHRCYSILHAGRNRLLGSRTVVPTPIKSPPFHQPKQRYQNYPPSPPSRRTHSLSDSKGNSKSSPSFSPFSTPKVVPNQGSIARDLLAGERTFLAWSRTGLGFVGAGSALLAAYPRPQQQQQQQQQQRAAALLVANGAFLLTFATRRYLGCIQHLLQDQFLVDTRGALVAVLVTAVSTVTSLGLVLRAEYAVVVVESERSSSSSSSL